MTRANGLGWSAAITTSELVARRALPSRAKAWIVTYGFLGLVGPRRGRITTSDPPPSIWSFVAGVGLSLTGYPLGRRILGDRPHRPPPDPLWLEIAALAGVVAPVEENLWGRIVQPSLGTPLTALLFAAKHVAIDGRARRALGLILFELGLGLVRRHSPRSALLLHAGANGAGAALGHLGGRDLF